MIFKIKLWLLENIKIFRLLHRLNIKRINKKLLKNNAGYIYMPYILSESIVTLPMDLPKSKVKTKYILPKYNKIKVNKNYLIVNI